MNPYLSPSQSEPSPEYEPPECYDCGGYMKQEIDGDEDGKFVVTWCPKCEGE